MNVDRSVTLQGYKMARRFLWYTKEPNLTLQIILSVVLYSYSVGGPLFLEGHVTIYASRMSMKLSRFCSVLIMFAEKQSDCFYAIMRKQCSRCSTPNSQHDELGHGRPLHRAPRLVTRAFSAPGGPPITTSGPLQWWRRGFASLKIAYAPAPV
ncbi:hypothetical protein EVAR_27743_1 [Eumeta japonica]|uniref:Uncharacterized protein n=1 Tax=Eumeta variegata TaxID=151549 RepID=A0A4C1VAZ7_EUMVA|nr:hypothetical protein EVAR_27743_1 [Eumeta japonica]